jgi:hypothetical protein
MFGWFSEEASSGFTTETFECLRVLGQMIRQEFQSDKTTKLSVLSLVNDAHSAAAELLNNAVMRDRLADHWRRSLCRENLQVNPTNEPTLKRLLIEFSDETVATITFHDYVDEVVESQM